MSVVKLLDSINVGDVLTEPVMNSFNQVLIPAGATLTEKHINLLKTWNIGSVCVQSSGVEEAVEEMSDELKAKFLQIYSERVTWEIENKYEQELWDMGLLCMIKYGRNKYNGA